MLSRVCFAVLVLLTIPAMVANVTYSRVIEIGFGQHVEDFRFVVELNKHKP